MVSSVERGVLRAAVIVPVATAAFLLFNAVDGTIQRMAHPTVLLGLLIPFYLSLAALFDPKWRGEPESWRQMVYTHGLFAALAGGATFLFVPEWPWVVLLGVVVHGIMLALLNVVMSDRPVGYRLVHFLTGFAAIAALRLAVTDLYGDPLLTTILGPAFFVLPFLAAFGTIVREEPPKEDRWARVRSELERYGKAQRERSAGQLSMSLTGDGKLSETDAETGTLSEP